MTDLIKVKAGDGFTYLDVIQRSPEWIKARNGLVTASRLGDWMAVGVKGQPLKSRLDYEKEIAYEREFGVSFQKFVNDAMLAGTEAEPFIKTQYELITGNTIAPVGVFVSDRFAATPDGLVNDDGLFEAKWLFDTSFSDILVTGEVPEEHLLQIQGQLWASGRKWCDYAAVNGNTKKIKIIRVYRNEEIINRIKESLNHEIDIKLNTENLYDFKEEVSW